MFPGWGWGMRFPAQRMDHWLQHNGRIVSLLLIGLLLFLTFLIAIRPLLPFTVDDTFISLRYAKHIAEGLGSVWNPDSPPLEGYTHPLYVLLLSILFHITKEPLLLVKGFLILSFFSSLLLAFFLIPPSFFQSSEDSWVREKRFLLLGAILLTPLTLIHVASGLETAFYTGILLLTFSLTLRFLHMPSSKNLALLILSLTLLSLTRPEGFIIWLTLALVFPFLLSRKNTSGFTGKQVFLLLFGSMISIAFLLELWRLTTFGMLLPLPAYVKSLHVGSIILNSLLSLPSLGLISIPLLPLLLLTSPSQRSEQLILFLMVLAQVVLYVFSERLMDYAFRFWYPAFILLFFSLILFPLKVRESSRSITVLLVFLISLALSMPHIFSLATYTEDVYGAHGILGKALAEQLSPLIIWINDAGLTPYLADQHTYIDIVGLNTPRIAREGTLGLRRLFNESPPDMIILLSAKNTTVLPLTPRNALVNDLSASYTLCPLSFPAFTPYQDPPYYLLLRVKNASLCNEFLPASEESWKLFLTRYPDSIPQSTLSGRTIRLLASRLNPYTPLRMPGTQTSLFKPEALPSGT